MKSSLKIFSTRIDLVTMDEAMEQIIIWTREKFQHYVVTTNVEFLMAARKDPKFRQIINQSDLSLPDSARFSWARAIINEKSFIKRLLLWPTFFTKDFPGREPFPVVAGVDLMQELCGKSVRERFTIGLLGGREGVALKTKECLEKNYPGIEVVFAEDGGKVDREGIARERTSFNNDNLVSTLHDQPIDILFVAFGQVKQEKWIVKYMDQIPAKVFIGVGGAFDYLSKNVPRAPKLLQNLGLEWLFRLLIQPWRIKRFGVLVQFVFLMMIRSKS